MKADARSQVIGTLSHSDCFFIEATRGSLDCGPLSRQVQTNGLSTTTACWGPHVQLSEYERVLRILLVLCLLRDAQAFRGLLSKQNITFSFKTDSYSKGSENIEELVFFIFKPEKS